MNRFGRPLVINWKTEQQNKSYDNDNESQRKQKKTHPTTKKPLLTASQTEAAAFREFRTGLKEFLGGIDVLEDDDDDDSIVFFGGGGGNCTVFDDCYNNNEYNDNNDDNENDDEEHTKCEDRSDDKGRAILQGGGEHHDGLKGREIEFMVNNKDNNNDALSDLDKDNFDDEDADIDCEDDSDFSFDPSFAVSVYETYISLSSGIRLPQFHSTTTTTTSLCKQQVEKQQQQYVPCNTQDITTKQAAAEVRMAQLSLIQTALDQYRSQLLQIKTQLKQWNCVLLHGCFPIIDPAVDKVTAIHCIKQTMQLELQYELIYQATEQLEDLLLESLLVVQQQDEPQLQPHNSAPSAFSSSSFSTKTTTTTAKSSSFSLPLSSQSKSQSLDVVVVDCDEDNKEQQDEFWLSTAEEQQQRRRRQEVPQQQQAFPFIINQQWITRFQNSVLSTIATHQEELKKHENFVVDEDGLFEEAVTRYTADSFLPPLSISTRTERSRRRGRGLWKQ